MQSEFIKEEKDLVLSYDENGNFTQDIEQRCAAQITFDITQKTKYYVKYGSSQLYNPNKTSDLRYNSRIAWKMVQVNKTAFDTYLQFLRTKREIFLHHAEREI